MIFENWYQLTQCSRQGDFKKVVFYQADRTISVASKIFSTASRDMIWVFEGLQMIISIFWNKRGGHLMLRNRFYRRKRETIVIFRNSYSLNWVQLGIQKWWYTSKKLIFCLFGSRRASKSCPRTSYQYVKGVNYLVEALQKILWR